MTASLAKIRLVETILQDRWNCEGTLDRVPTPEGFEWARYGVVAKLLSRVGQFYWSPDMEKGHEATY